MKRSAERILTTHVGSLARPTALLDVMREKENDRPYDHDEFRRLVRESVADVVRKQAEVGLDVITDGEMGKVTFATYVKERLSGTALLTLTGAGGCGKPQPMHYPSRGDVFT